MLGSLQRPPQDVLVCEDHPFIQLGLKISLSEILPNLRTLHVANMGKDALRLAEKHKPSLAIVDLGLPDMLGTDLINQLKVVQPEIKIIVLTSCENPTILDQARKLGVRGIVQKSSPPDYLRQILSQIDQNLSSNTLLDPATKSILQEQEHVEFTPREFDVLQEIVHGKTNQQIADNLGCAITTVRFHRANIMDKTNIRNAAELTAWFLQGQSKRN